MGRAATGLVMLTALLLPGCLNGRLYTNVVQPQSRDFHGTPVGGKKFVLHTYRVREPFSGRDLSAEWDTTALKTAAAAAGIHELHYTDVRVFSVFFGTFRRTTLILYGD
jgi:hypothetical protein